MSTQLSISKGIQNLPIRGGGAGVSPARPQMSLTFKDVLGILRRRMWMIIIITSISAVLGVVLWYVLKQNSPKYTSVGFIRCKMPSQSGLYGVQSSVPRQDVIEMETASAAEQMNSESFLSQLLQRSKIQQLEWFRKRNDPEKRLDDMKSSFSAVPRRDTNLIIVQMSASNPKEAKIIVDDALQSFYSQMSDMATKSLRDSMEALTKQRRDVESSLRQLQSSLQEMERLAGVPGWQGGEGRTVVMQELSLLHEEQLRLQSQMQQLQIYAAQLQQERNSAGYSSTVRMAIERDPMVMGYRSQIANLSQQRDMLIQRLGADHRQVKDIQNIINISQEQMDNREQMLQQQFGTQELRMVDNQIQGLQLQLRSVSTQYDNISNQQRDLDQKLISYQNTRDEINKLNMQVQELEREIGAINVKISDPERVTVEIANNAVEPLEISFPKLSVFLPGGIMLGLFISVGFTFLLEFMDDTLKTPRDVMRNLDIAMLGMIPLYEEEDEEEICVEKVAMIHPHALISEFYRKVRTNLFFSAPTGELKTVLVTSSSADCGKTTTAINLAITIAAEGKRVLLVDSNFRRPALNHLFPEAGAGRGLSNVLIGQATVADAIRQSGIEGLDLMDCGPVPPNPADLLNSERMREFLESQKQFYHYILLDGPPSLLVTDANILAGLVDGTVVVIHAEQTSRGMCQRMVNELKQSRARILGVVLNAVRPRKGGYFEKAYRSYYDYIGGEPVLTEALPKAEESIGKIENIGSIQEIEGMEDLDDLDGFEIDGKEEEGSSDDLNL